MLRLHASAYRNLNLAKWQYYAQCRMADFGSSSKRHLAEIDALADLPGITAIRPRIQFYATVDLEPRWPQPLNGLVLSLPNTRATDHQRHRA